MPLKTKLALAALAARIILEVVDRSNKKHRAIVDEYNELVEDRNALASDLHYMIQVVNENEIKLDEFDLLVLTNVKEKD